MWDLFTGDEHDNGGPGLKLSLQTEVSVVAETLLSLSRWENEFSVSTTNDSNRLVEKFGMPQFTQCQETLLSDM